jgi:hypothetical protein
LNYTPEGYILACNHGAPLRIFETKWFVRFARKENIEPERLWEAIERAEQGSIDAELGGNLIKQRVARPGGGRSGGFRTIIAYRAKTRSIFLYGFPKNVTANIDRDDLEILKKLARRFLSMTDKELEKAVTEQELIEVHHDDNDKKEVP